jgi:hypothetical protein
LSLRGEAPSGPPDGRASGPSLYFYATRAQRTRASAIRSHDRRRLRSSARAAAARRLAGMAARRASTDWALADVDVLRLLEEASVPANGRPLVLLRLKRLAPLGLSGFLVDDRDLGTGVDSLPAGEINADLAPLLRLVRRVRDVNLEFARSPLFGNATGSAQEILQAEEQLRILENNVHAAMRSPEWPQRGRLSQFQQRVCDVKRLPGLRPLGNQSTGDAEAVRLASAEQPNDDGA